MAPSRESERSLLLRVARQAMLDHGLEPDFPPAALVEANAFSGAARSSDGGERDLRALPWCSIDTPAPTRRPFTRRRGTSLCCPIDSAPT